MKKILLVLAVATLVLSGCVSQSQTNPPHRADPSVNLRTPGFDYYY